jgi:hypothetical protein
MDPCRSLMSLTRSIRRSGQLLAQRERLNETPDRRLIVKGFGCRPVVTYPRALRAGVRKPPGKEPAVGGTGGGRLWRFDGGAARASDALRD